MQTIAMLRHLPTVDDVGDVYTPASANPPLAEIASDVVDGLRAEIQAVLGANPETTLWSSDNPRGRTTVEVLVGGAADVHLDARLNNILQPEWAGQHQSKVKRTDRYKLWHTRPEAVQFEHGESLADVKARVSDFLNDLGERSAIIFSHTTPMQVLACQLMRLPVGHIWSLKFDHLRWSLFVPGILLRLNADSVSDLSVADLKLPPSEEII